MAKAKAKTKAAERTPEVGDPVIHHGRAHKITALPRRAVMRDGEPTLLVEVVFENERYLVRGHRDELVWSEEDDAWLLPGRLLARDERVLHEAVVGSWPRPEQHHAARRYLDGVDLESVPRERLRDVLLRKKLRVLAEQGIVSVHEDGDGPPGIRIEDEDALEAYMDRVIEHARELRALREGG